MVEAVQKRGTLQGKQNDGNERNAKNKVKIRCGHMTRKNVAVE